MTKTTSNRPIRRVSFQLSLDRTRPHEIDEAYRDDAAVIRYRYTDNGEQVSVPNTWNNRPAERRSRDELLLAEAAEQRAAELERNPPAGIDPESVQLIVAHHRLKATRLRATNNTAAIERATD
jgi:hypothetical protein